MKRALEVLRQNSLENVVLLKLLHASFDGSTIHQVVRGPDSATLLVVDHRFSSFDRKSYPMAKASVVISSDHPELTRELLALVPRGWPLVFKLSNEADRQAVSEEFALERKAAYHSYTSMTSIPVHPGADIEIVFDSVLSRMFEEQGHDPEWLCSLLEGGRAFISVAKDNGRPRSACFAFQIDGAIWEIGGVYTLPEERGKGLGACVVRTALATLTHRGNIPRYQVAEENGASIRLAEALGMRRFLTLTHYLSEP